jgi:hypothetical protein
MKIQRFALALTAVNLVILVVLLANVLPSTPQAVGLGFAQAPAASAQTVVPVLRGRALELLDTQDQVRSRINVEPNGEVVLRLLDRNGTIRVKLGASETGSGLVLLDEETEPGVHIVARRAGTTSLTLRSGPGQKRVITP